MSAAGFEETDLNYAVEDSEPGHDPECGGEADDPGQGDNGEGGERRERERERERDKEKVV